MAHNSKSRAAYFAALTTLALLTGCAGNPMLEEPAKLAETSTAVERSPLPPAKSADAAKVAPEATPSPDVQSALAEARKLKSSGKPKEAVAVLEKARAANPDQRQLGVEQGLIALELGHPKEAQRILAKTEPVEAKDWRALSGLGIAHASQGRQAEAQRFFKQALDIEPNNATVLNNLAMSLLLERKVDEAEVLLRRATASASAKPEVARNLALAQSLKGQPSTELKATP